MAEQRSTLVKPPPLDSTKAQIENALELTDLSIIGPDIFTNTRELWHPPGARGIYGGAVIAQTLAAAQRTVPADFVVHSYHCYFVLAGDSSTPILYHVERVREGRSFCTRTVQARQRGKAIFTVTMSFTKEGSGGAAQVRHAAAMPEGVTAPPDDYDEEFGGAGGGFSSPFQTYRIEVTGKDGPAEQKKTRHWVRARGRISEEGGHQAHLSALAYVSDSHFIGTVGRIHRLWRFPFPHADLGKVPEHVRNRVVALNEWEGMGPVEEMAQQPSIGMMVSLDHTIYFHNPKKVRADEWMFTEMESPWSGDGRGVVIQRLFSKDGTLLATCFQEGVVRLAQKEDASRSKL
ncbi:thioesterase-like superfamily-domain-containing protein [Apiospora kogelbergensis]|uniref:Thioesterase-like superfamily-domain-containing protein n=1 Tax=Apiospora kogelbergensis TaxID=1337665 RepID=A0AAW0RCT3_9PEZI